MAHVPVCLSRHHDHKSPAAPGFFHHACSLARKPRSTKPHCSKQSAYVMAVASFLSLSNTPWVVLGAAIVPQAPAIFNFPGNHHVCTYPCSSRRCGAVPPDCHRSHPHRAQRPGCRVTRRPDGWLYFPVPSADAADSFHRGAIDSRSTPWDASLPSLMLIGRR